MKYKILGYSLVCFIIFMVGLSIWAEEEISSSLFSHTNIDSIRIHKQKRSFTITSRDDIIAISHELKNAQKIKNIQCERCFSSFYDLDVYVRKASKPIFLRIYFNDYDGVLLKAGSPNYRGKGLDSLMATLKIW